MVEEGFLFRQNGGISEGSQVPLVLQVIILIVS